MINRLSARDLSRREPVILTVTSSTVAVGSAGTLACGAVAWTKFHFDQFSGLGAEPFTLIGISLAGSLLSAALIGGTLRHDALVTVGAETVDALRMIRADVVILGVCAVHPELGVTTADLEEAHVKRAMIDGAAAVVALADHDKLGTAMSVFVAPIDAITTLITDSDVNAQSLERYQAAGVEVLYA